MPACLSRVCACVRVCVQVSVPCVLCMYVYVSAFTFFAFDFIVPVYLILYVLPSGVINDDDYLASGYTYVPYCSVA